MAVCPCNRYDYYSMNYKNGGEWREHMQNVITFLGNYIDSGSISVVLRLLCI